MKNAETPQAILEKVKELQTTFDKLHELHRRGKKGDADADTEAVSLYPQLQTALIETFPSIASLVESQAKRIEELEKALQEERNSDCFECGYGISI